MSDLKGLLLKTWRIGTCVLSKGGRETRQTPTEPQSSDRNIINITQMKYQLILGSHIINHSTVTRHSQRDCKQEDKNNEKVQNNLVMIQ